MVASLVSAAFASISATLRAASSSVRGAAARPSGKSAGPLFMVTSLVSASSLNGTAWLPSGKSAGPPIVLSVSVCSLSVVRISCSLFCACSSFIGVMRSPLGNGTPYISIMCVSMLSALIVGFWLSSPLVLLFFVQQQAAVEKPRSERSAILSLVFIVVKFSSRFCVYNAQPRLFSVS